MAETRGLNRRDFLKGGLAVAAGSAFVGAAARRARAAVEGGEVRVVAGVENPTNDGHYVPNREPLQAVPFQKLPPGAVEARGWLRQQLDLQVRGLCGRYDEISDFLDYNDTGWVDPSKGAWEELPYWIRGFGDLGYVTGNAGVLERADRWIQGIMSTQASDGWFGPNELRTSLEGGPDFWPGMPTLGALRSWHEYSDDERVLPFMSKYLEFQNRQPLEVFNRSWGALRWGDNIDSAYWLYNRTGDSWLLDLVEKMHEGSADYTSGIPNWHNVNLAQGFREPLQYGLLAKDPMFRDATYRNYDEIMGRYGQFSGGGFAGDENSRPGFGDPRQGFETCGIVEFMHSFEMLTRFTGDTVWTERCEELAFNMMPAAFDPEQKSVRYISGANMIQLDDRVKHGQFQNSFPMLAYKPAVYQYRCCPHNYGMGWPYYTQELWLATHDRGLAASMYAASQVRAKVGEGEGVEVTMTEKTEYPFGDSISLSLSTPRSVAFPLYLRIPSWTKGATAKLNGKSLPVETQPGGYVVVDRQWRDGDQISLKLPMRVTVKTWEDNHDSVSVNRGPLTYSLAIKERYERFNGTPDWPEYAVYPESSWNYGLVLPKTLPGRAFDVVKRDVKPDTNPFTHEGARLQLRAPARRLPEWQADGEDVVGVLQDSPAASEGRNKTVTLIPMGAARLRITSFPTIQKSGEGNEWELPPIATASNIPSWDSYEALYDGKEATASDDPVTPRFTWWDRRGTTEWVRYDLRQTKTVSAVSVYFFDDSRTNGGCRVPASWQLLYRDGDAWRPVEGASAYGTAKDQYNRVTFTPVETNGLRIEVRLQPGFSSGLYEWKVE